MTEQQAAQIALQARPEFEVPQDFELTAAERRIIEIVENGQPVRDELPAPGPVRDTVAWVVTLGSDVLWAEFAVEDATGLVVRIRRSRGAVGAVHEVRS